MRASIYFTYFVKLTIKCKPVTRLPQSWHKRRAYKGKFTFQVYYESNEHPRNYKHLFTLKKVKLLSWLQDKSSMGIT